MTTRGTGLEPRQIIAIPSATVLVQYSPEETSTTNSTPTKKKEIVITHGGAYRFKWHVRGNRGGAFPCNSYAQLYRNGAQWGAVHVFVDQFIPITIVEEIGGWAAEDLAQLYLWSSNPDTVYASGFGIWGTYGTAPPNIPPGVVTLA